MNPDEIEALGVQADGLLADHERLLGELIALRRDRRMTEQAVAERMGVSEQDVVEFERYDSNPTLDLVRRYALAVGARLETRVIDGSPDAGRLRLWPGPRREDWRAS